MKSKSIFNITCTGNLLTRQRALFKSTRRGDSRSAIATRFTCQRALYNRGKRQGDSPRAVDTDLVHGSSTKVQNRVQLRENLSRTYEKLSRTYEKLLSLMTNHVNLSQTMISVYLKVLRIYETNVDVDDILGDLGNKSKVDEICNFLRTYDKRIQKRIDFRPLPDINSTYLNLSTFTIQVKQKDSQKYNAFIRSTGRSRSKTRHLSHLKRHDREPSRIPMKKFVNLMMKNRKKRSRIKRYIRQFIPKSSALHNLLSTRYRKHASQKLTNIYMWQFGKPCRPRRMPKLIKKENLKNANMCYSRTKQHKFCTLNNPKIPSTNKCNIQRIKTSNKRFLFMCGDVCLIYRACRHLAHGQTILLYRQLLMQTICELT